MLNEESIKRYLLPLTPLPTNTDPFGTIDTGTMCILFDIYGTLFISGSGDIGMSKSNVQNLSKLERLLTKYRIPGPARNLLEVFFKQIEAEHGRATKNGVQYPEVDIIHIWKQVLKTYETETIRDFAIEFEMIVNPVYPMPHLAELLATCRQKNIRMGIISNAQFYTALLFEWFLNANLTALGFTMELVLLSYRYGQAKPSELLFQQAVDQLKDLGIHPRSVLYLGNDMLNDIYPAHTVGFQTALFAGDARSLRLRKNDPRCRDLSADLVITDLLQLVDLLC